MLKSSVTTITHLYPVVCVTVGRISDHYRSEKICASMGSWTPASHYLGEHHTARPRRHIWSLSHSPHQGESMSSCILSSETTMVTKCNSGSKKWPLAIRKKLCLNGESHPGLSLSGPASYTGSCLRVNRWKRNCSLQVGARFKQTLPMIMMKEICALKPGVRSKQTRCKRNPVYGH